MPRMGDAEGTERYPHIRLDLSSVNVVCYCDVCDEEVEKRISENFCICDQYLRWICLPCSLCEGRQVEQGQSAQTDDIGVEEDFSHQMVLPDHQHTRAVHFQTLYRLRT